MLSFRLVALSIVIASAVGGSFELYETAVVSADAVAHSLASSASLGRGQRNELQQNNKAPTTVQSDAINRTRTILDSVRQASFPELAGTDLRIRTFQSNADFFRTRFSASHFTTFQKMRFYLEVNPRVYALNAPAEGIRAIIAHELEHVVYLNQRNRISDVSLVRLASGDYTARFERSADLHAIARGYGAGLIAYREWLYQNVTPAVRAAKQRDYFSPDEIRAIQTISARHPQALPYWLKHVPMNLDEIKSQDR